MTKYIKFSKPSNKKKEIKSVASVLRSGWLTTGKKLKISRRNLKNIKKQNTPYFKFLHCCYTFKFIIIEYKKRR